MWVDRRCCTAAIGVLASACYDPVPAAPCTVACSATVECPDGLECDSGGQCHEPGTPACNCIEDDFTSADVDLTRWSVTRASAGGSVSQGGGDLRLVMSVNADDLGYLLVDAVAPISLRDTTLTLEVPETVSQGGFVESGVALIALPSRDRYEFIAGATALTCLSEKDATQNLNTIPYVAAQQRFWRIRFAATAVFEYSGDGSAWTRCHETSLSVPLGALTVELYAGRFAAGNPTPGLARIANLRTSSCAE